MYSSRRESKWNRMWTGVDSVDSVVGHSVMSNVDVVIASSNVLNTHDALVAAATNDELEVSRYSICAWHCLGEANVVEFPHIIYFPEPLK